MVEYVTTKKYLLFEFGGLNTLNLVLAPQTFSYRYEVNTLAYFNCHQGYYREGSGSAICQSSGNWSEETPICVAASKENEPLYSMSVTFYNTFEDTCPFIGPLIPLFQTSGDPYSSRFQSQSGQSCSHLVEAYMMYIP